MYAWGEGSSGQLGLSAAVRQAARPTLVRGISDSVVQVAAGGAQSAALTSTGRVFVWGWRDAAPPLLYVQCRATRARERERERELTCESASEPTLVLELVPYYVRAVAVGLFHVLALVDYHESSAVFAWGKNQYGQVRLAQCIAPHQMRVAIAWIASNCIGLTRLRAARHRSGRDSRRRVAAAGAEPHQRLDHGHLRQPLQVGSHLRYASRIGTRGCACVPRSHRLAHTRCLGHRARPRVHLGPRSQHADRHSPRCRAECALLETRVPRCTGAVVPLLRLLMTPPFAGSNAAGHSLLHA